MQLNLAGIEHTRSLGAWCALLPRYGTETREVVDVRSFLSQDEASGELRLVFTDLWDGMHERTEFRVINSDGSPIRRYGHLNGVPAYHGAGCHYIRVDGQDVPFQVETGVMPTEKTVCRRLASKSGRAKCLLCEIT